MKKHSTKKIIAAILTFIIVAMSCTSVFSIESMTDDVEEEVFYSYKTDADTIMGIDVPENEADIDYFESADIKAYSLSSNLAKSMINNVKVYPQLTGYTKLDTKIDQILKGYENSDTYTKLKILYDWCVRNIEFNWDSYGEKNWDGFKYKYPYNDYTFDYDCPIPEEVINRGYYAIFNGKGVCYNYASAFAIMARHIGLEAYVHTYKFVWNPSYSTIHAWVEIPIDGEYYIFDPQQEYRASGDGKKTIPYKFFFLRHSEDERFVWETEENYKRDASFLSVDSMHITVKTSENGSVKGNGVYKIGEKCDLEAIPNNNNTFTGWYENGSLVSKETVYSFEVTGNKNLTAMFSGNSFYDVVKSDWYYDTVNKAYEIGLMKGVNEIIFDPKSTTTRAMMVTIMARMAKIDLNEYNKPSIFTDVKDDAWYLSAVNWAYENNITTGKSETEFCPDDKLTREESNAFIIRFFDMMDYKLPQNNEVITFKDHDDISEWALESVETMQKAGLIGGFTDLTFKPKNMISRAEIATIISRCYTDIEIKVEGKGSVKNDKYVLFGNEFKAQAIPEENYWFLGWYEDDNFISSEMEYTFKSEDNKQIIAKFAE